MKGSFISEFTVCESLFVAKVAPQAKVAPFYGT